MSLLPSNMVQENANISRLNVTATKVKEIMKTDFWVVCCDQVQKFLVRIRLVDRYVKLSEEALELYKRYMLTQRNSLQPLLCYLVISNIDNACGFLKEGVI